MADDGYLFPVDLTSIMLFASSLGETNRAYYDEEYAEERGLGGVIMPPTFPSASSHWNPRHGLRGVRQIPAAPPENPLRNERRLNMSDRLVQALTNPDGRYGHILWHYRSRNLAQCRTPSSRTGPAIALWMAQAARKTAFVALPLRQKTKPCSIASTTAAEAANTAFALKGLCDLTAASPLAQDYF